MNRVTSKLNPTDATDECHPDIFKPDSLKVPKLLLRFSLTAANSLATSIRQSLSVLCLWVLSIVRLLNLVCFIVERSHLFSLRAEEKDLSPAALVAGFTRRSLHRVMISVIIHCSASEICLILAKMSLKQVNSQSHPLRGPWKGVDNECTVLSIKKEMLIGRLYQGRMKVGN